MVGCDVTHDTFLHQKVLHIIHIILPTYVPPSKEVQYHGHKYLKAWQPYSPPPQIVNMVMLACIDTCMYVTIVPKFVVIIKFKEVVS